MSESGSAGLRGTGDELGGLHESCSVAATVKLGIEGIESWTVVDEMKMFCEMGAPDIGL